MKRDKMPPDPRGGHVRLHWMMIDSPAWCSLSATDQRVYVALRRHLGKTNNGDLSLPLSRARHHQVTSPATLAKALRALNAVGLIAVTRKGGCARGGTRLPTLYRFTDEQVHAMPGKYIEASRATDEWKVVSSIAHGKALIQQVEAAAREKAHEQRRRKSLLQISNGTATSSEAVKPLTTTATEAWRAPPLRIVKQANGSAKPPDASKDAGSSVCSPVKH